MDEYHTVLVQGEINKAKKRYCMPESDSLASVFQVRSLHIGYRGQGATAPETAFSVNSASGCAPACPFCRAPKVRKKKHRLPSDRMPSLQNPMMVFSLVHVDLRGDIHTRSGRRPGLINISYAASSPPTPWVTKAKKKS